MKYEPLPELDSSLPENDLACMVNAIIVACVCIGLVMWAVK